jgi:hypothetical protein
MLKQIFRKNVPNEILFRLLDKICLKYEKYYYIDNNAYNKMRFHEFFNEFREDIREYYHHSKHFYLDRPLTYKSFTNIVRQICKNNAIVYNKQMNYNESKYNIDYYVYF